MKDDKPKLNLVGKDGNAFNILGLAMKAAKEAKWPQKKIDAFFQEAISSNYNHLLAICKRYFDVS